MNIIDGFYNTFVYDDRYKIIIDGFLNTIIIAFFAALLGIFIGILVSVIRFYCVKNKKMKILSFLIDVYVTVIRGTPIVIQLLIAYFIVLSNIDSALIVSIIAFGVNSGAYVSEIIRAGIQSVDLGQNEAGRCLGFNEIQTMTYIIMPQAIKNILPSLLNECISLLKETSVAGYITIVDLTKAGDMIRAKTFDPYFSLLSVAAIYLVVVMILTYLSRKLERRLSKSDRS